MEMDSRSGTYFVDNTTALLKGYGDVRADDVRTGTPDHKVRYGSSRLPISRISGDCSDFSDNVVLHN